LKQSEGFGKCNTYDVLTQLKVAGHFRRRLFCNPTGSVSGIVAAEATLLGVAKVVVLASTPRNDPKVALREERWRVLLSSEDTPSEDDVEATSLADATGTARLECTPRPPREDTHVATAMWGLTPARIAETGARITAAP